ncbi:hypothetical protein G8A07_21195 [Roseateles sp. DAIF2]|uniref:hypothetical protein n=1 Tax=Roseateles sp. DAIF2 TaxID=2714952 RepID=UPI0018A2DF20|nr:hypothetical protein [Roseateles sp. DAIF2]QPF75183.1 hypothetical protein G8A07_21195 [Roseateles sp. DAIF2]
MRTKTIRWLLLPALLALLPALGRAALVDCQPAAGRFTVFLSEPSGPLFTQPAQLRQFMQQLQFELDQNRDARWVLSPGTDVRFVACPGRAPALDGQDFGRDIVDALHTRRVLLEVWGLLSSGPGADGRPQPQAQMNFLLVPLQQAANEQGASAAAGASALQRLRYPEAGAAPTSDPVLLIARPTDIDAFVASAFGLKLLRERSFELAHRNLCRAGHLLGAIARRPLAGRSRDDLARLREQVRAAAGQAVAQAKADANYPKLGLLRLREPAQPCDAEEG